MYLGLIVQGCGGLANFMFDVIALSCTPRNAGSAFIAKGMK